MLEVVKVIDNKPTPQPGHIWERDGAKYLINSMHQNVIWAYKLQNGDVTETAIDLDKSWCFRAFKGSAEARDQIIDAMADALYEQEDTDNSERIYELSKIQTV